jgi:hypothetical protein
MDCTKYHSVDVLTEAGIEVFPSTGHAPRVQGGYPPNSHDSMPCELINNKFKEMTQKKFNKTADLTPKHEQSVLRNWQNSRTIPGGLRQRPNCVFAEDNGSDY